jgi:hypothetical protein
MKIRSVGTELFYADGQTEKRTDSQIQRRWWLLFKILRKRVVSLNDARCLLYISIREALLRILRDFPWFVNIQNTLPIQLCCAQSQWRVLALHLAELSITKCGNLRGSYIVCVWVITRRVLLSVHKYFMRNGTHFMPHKNIMCLESVEFLSQFCAKYIATVGQYRLMWN